MSRTSVVLRVLSSKGESPRKLKHIRRSAAKPRKLSPAKREQLILEYREKARLLASSMLRRWRSRLDPQEVESIVDLSLCEAVHRFRTGKGASFMTFLFYHLKGNLVRTVSAAANKGFLPLLDAEPHAQEGDHYGYGVSPSELYEYESGDQDNSPESLLIRKEEAELASEACGKLDPLEQEVVGRLYGHEQQLLDIARHLGYSRCHISRVKKKALENLFDELAPQIAAGETLKRPEFGSEESEDQPRRKVQRRRPRANAEQNPRRLRLAKVSGS